MSDDRIADDLGDKLANAIAKLADAAGECSSSTANASRARDFAEAAERLSIALANTARRQSRDW